MTNLLFYVLIIPSCFGIAIFDYPTNFMNDKQLIKFFHSPSSERSTSVREFGGAKEERKKSVLPETLRTKDVRQNVSTERVPKVGSSSLRKSSFVPPKKRKVIRR
jgi:hypothetical protein